MTQDIRLWHPSRPGCQLPTPGIPLVVRGADGYVAEAERKSYVGSYDDDPGYTEPGPNGKRLIGVTHWSIK